MVSKNYFISQRSSQKKNSSLKRYSLKKKSSKRIKSTLLESIYSTYDPDNYILNIKNQNYKSLLNILFKSNTKKEKFQGFYEMIVEYCNQDPSKKNNHFKEGIITIAEEMGFDRSELNLKSTEDICIELLYSDYAPSFTWFRKIKMTLTSNGRVKYLLKNIKMLLTHGLIYCSIMRPKYEPDIGQLTCWAMNGQKHINELKKYRDELLIYSRLGHGTGLTDLSNLRMNKTSIFSFGTISNEMKTQLLQLDNILKTIITNSEHFLKILKSKPDIIRSVSLVESEKKKKLANKISIIYGALVVADAVSSINRNISASQRDKNMGKYYRENAQTLKYQRRMMKEHIGKPSRSNK